MPDGTISDHDVARLTFERQQYECAIQRERAKQERIETANRRAESRTLKARAKTEEALAELTVQESKTLADLDEDNWTLLGGGGSGVYAKRHTELTSPDNRLDQLQRVYVLSRRNPHAKAIIGAMQKFLAARPVQLVAKDLNPKVQAFWDEFTERTNFQLRLREMIKRCFRDGEWFLRRFVNGGYTDLRFIDADRISTPEQYKDNPAYSDGVQTDPDDNENIIAYWLKTKVVNGEQSWKPIEADRIQHGKLCDSTEKRGQTHLEPVLDTIQEYGNFISKRMVIQRLAAMFLWHMKKRGLSPSVSSATKSSQLSTDSYDRKKHQPLPTGTMITTGDNVEITPLRPNLRAEDAQYDGKAILNQIAAGTGLADFVTSGDISQANFSSAMVSEGPMVLEIQYWQGFFNVHLKRIYRWVIEEGIAAGRLPKATVYNRQDATRGRPIATNIKCDVIWPDVSARDIKKEADARAVHQQMEIVSRRTLAAKCGYDWEQEQRYMAVEEPIPKPQQQKPGEDNEEDTSEQAIARELVEIRRMLDQADKACEVEKEIYADAKLGA